MLFSLGYKGIPLVDELFVNHLYVIVGLDYAVLRVDLVQRLE